MSNVNPKSEQPQEAATREYIIDKRGGFTVIENGIFEAGLTPYELAVYCILVRHANNETRQAFPSMTRISKMARVSRTMLIQALKRLAELGLVTVEQRTVTGKGNISNLYTILPVRYTPLVRHTDSPLVRHTDSPSTPHAPKLDSGNKTQKEPPAKRERAKALPRKECPPEPVYEALERLVYGIEPDPETPYAWARPIGQITQWLKGEIASVAKTPVGKLSSPATTAHILQYVKAYKADPETKGLSVPRDPYKFVMSWRKVAQALNARKARTAPTAGPIDDGVPSEAEQEETRRLIEKRGDNE